MTFSDRQETPPDDPWLETAVTLSLLRRGPGTRSALILKLLSDRVLFPETFDDQLPNRLAEYLGISAPVRAARLAGARDEARRLLADRPRHRLIPVTGRDDSYPEPLRHIADPPIVLWVRGNLSVLTRPAVAIVGSRNATPAAVTIGRRLARDLSNAGLVIASGMARGVDGAAHLGALDAGGLTIGVLGCGADVVYPREHSELAARIADSGGLVSELPPGTEPRAGHFPLRNRIISGMSRAVVVVEASDRSGSLITARMALEQGRDVLAVPGNVLSGRSSGCHALIRDGARIVESASDVLEHIGWTSRQASEVPIGTNSLQLNGLEETMARGEPYSVDDLAVRTGRSAQTLLADLGTLELAGRIVRTAGGQYIRLD